MNSPRSKALATFLAAVPLALLAASPARGETRLDLRFLPSYFGGEFGTGIRIHILLVPSILVVNREKHEFRLTVPYVSITASRPVTYLGDQVIERGPGGSNTESGPGDGPVAARGARPRPTVVRRPIAYRRIAAHHVLRLTEQVPPPSQRLDQAQARAAVRLAGSEPA